MVAESDYMGDGDFRPQQRRPLISIFIKLEKYNYLPDTTPHAKLQGDMSTWVVCANSQFDA